VLFVAQKSTNKLLHIQHYQKMSSQPTELLIALLKPTFGSFYNQLKKQNVDISSISTDEFWDMFMGSITNTNASTNASKKVKVSNKASSLATPVASTSSSSSLYSSQAEKKLPTKKKVNKVNKVVVEAEAVKEVVKETKEVEASIVACQYANCTSKARKGVVGENVYCASHAKKMLSKSGSSSSLPSKNVTILSKRPASLISSPSAASNDQDDVEAEPDAKKTNVFATEVAEVENHGSVKLVFDFINEAPVDIEDSKFWVFSAYEIDGYENVQLHFSTQVLLIKQAESYVCIGYLDANNEFISIDKLKQTSKHIVSWMRMCNVGIYSAKDVVAPVNPFITFSQQFVQPSQSSVVQPAVSWDDLMDEDEEEEEE
jgi:hypothetical protein